LAWRVYRWAVGRFKRTCPNSYQWYRSSIRAINSYAPLRDTPLDKLGSEVIAQFAAFRREKRKSVNTVNSNLRALRASLTLAQEQGLIVTVPKVRFLSGELRRDRVLTENELVEYLAVCAPGALGECDGSLLADVVTVLADTGMRRGELFGMTWEAVSFELGRHGMLYVVAGKTSAARRPIPMTERVSEILRRRWNDVGQPMIGTIFPADTLSGHIEESTLRKGHKKALALSGVRAFSFHVLRHTFLTKLGACGIDSFSLARIAGHTSPRMTARYIHPTDATIIRALEGFQQVNALPALAAAQSPAQSQ
jgi:integrase